jgi:uncharacterized LabA/DUF88 family protein
MDGDTYLFIDGGYFRKRCDHVMEQVFGCMSSIDFHVVQNWFRQRYRVKRVFYYDCLHDIRKESESEEDFAKRVGLQKKYFANIQALSGFHVRLGRLSGTSKSPRQKQVDVRLAVDVIDHASRKNMDNAILIAGDEDFTPLVESVVRPGTWVEVFYDPRSVAEELCTAADQSVPMNFNLYFEWSTEAFKRLHQLPQYWHGITGTADQLGRIMKEGANAAGQYVALGQRPGEYFAYWQSANGPVVSRHPNAQELEQWFAVCVTSPVWKGAVSNI